MPFCFHWMLVVRATEIHSEYKKRGQSAVVRILTDWNWTANCKTLEINTAPSATEDQRLSLSKAALSLFFPHLLVSQHISAALFSIISCLSVIKLSNPPKHDLPWPLLSLLYSEQPPSHHLNVFVTREKSDGFCFSFSEQNSR